MPCRSKFGWLTTQKDSNSSHLFEFFCVRKAKGVVLDAAGIRRIGEAAFFAAQPSRLMTRASDARSLDNK